jgi:hypothetical protein
MHAPLCWRVRQPPLEEGPDRERRSQPVRRNRRHCRHHHRHSKVDGWRVRSRVRIGAGAQPAWGRRCSQPVCQNCHHRRHHHHHSKVDGRRMRSRVRIGAWARPGCRPARRLVLGHYGHRVTKGAGTEQGRDGEIEGEMVRHCNPHSRGHCARPIGLHKGDRPKRL